jgi:hypothetical protein
MNNATQKAYNFIKSNYNVEGGKKVEGGKVVIYGYSQGGALAQHLVKRLEAENIPVQLLVTVDAASGPQSSVVDRSIPENVVFNQNYYQRTLSKVLSRGDKNTAVDSKKTYVNNADYTGEAEHSDIDEKSLESAKQLIIRTVDRNPRKLEKDQPQPE